jgi:hypothetical protein
LIRITHAAELVLLGVATLEALLTHGRPHAARCTNIAGETPITCRYARRSGRSEAAAQ